MRNRRDDMGAVPGQPLARLQALLDTYGAAGQRWPADQRESARALIKASAEARAAVRQAAALDRALDSVIAPPASAELQQRLAALDPTAVAPPAASWRATAVAAVRQYLAGRPAAMAASAIAGLVVGVIVGTQLAVTPQPNLSANLAILEEGGLAPIEPFVVEPDEGWTDEGVLALALH